MSIRFPLRVVLMDDDFFALKGVAALLSRDLRTIVVDECNSAEDLLQTVKKSRPKPDVILVDAEYRHSAISIDDLLRRTRASAPEATIIYWTQYGDPNAIRKAASARVNGIFVKSEVELGLASAIERAVISQNACTPSVLPILEGYHDKWLGNVTLIEPWQLHPDLSPRLEQVFWLCIVYGMSVRAAAAEMCVQPETVERYRMKIYDIIDDGWNNEKYLSAARERIVGAQEQKIFVLVGHGNNGGDGLVAGRYLAEAGANVTFYLHKKRGDDNFKRLLRLKVQILHREQDNGLRLLYQHVVACDVLIDAMLGTGVTRPIGGELALVFRQMKNGLARHSADSQPSITNLSKIPPRKPKKPFVVAVDCPSGLHCNTGIIDPLAISADLTVTFAGPKRGHFIFPGAAHCGEIEVVDIGITPEIAADVKVDVATEANMREMLPSRPLNGHKGTFGSVMIVGGSADYLGAPILSTQGALRAGAGLVGLAIPKTIRPIAATKLPEATYPMLPDVDYLGVDSAEALLSKLNNFKAILLGPGLGTQSDNFLTTLIDSPNLPPLIVDADALNYLSRQPNWWHRLPPNCVLTPHPGEMRRLTGEPVREQDRIVLAQSHAEKWGHIVVLKGAHTVIASPDGTATLIPIATPLLAVAGSGDVLGGVIVSLLGQGLDPYAAAVLGAFLHASAGIELSKSLGNAGLLASQIADAIPLIRGRLDGTIV